MNIIKAVKLMKDKKYKIKLSESNNQYLTLDKYSNLCLLNKINPNLQRITIHRYTFGFHFSDITEEWDAIPLDSNDIEALNSYNKEIKNKYRLGE